MTAVMNELIEAGLLTGSDNPNLSEKGREWMRKLEDVDHRATDLSEAAADLVLSTNGLYR